MFLVADAARLPFPDKAFSLVIGSPPYSDARSYGIGAQRNTSDWIEWMLQVTAEAVRVSRGLVLWVCAGVTRDWCYQPGPEGLLYEWWRRGGRCWRSAFWHRVGIPGSGGKQGLRADIEHVLFFTGCKAEIPWADNTANGHPPKWAPGGEMSYRNSAGERRNEWGSTGHATGMQGKKQNGEFKRRATRGSKKGDTVQEKAYLPPKLANPGNLVKFKVGGGLMGSDLASLNEAPYPQKLPEWFIRSYCPPGGMVCDPFSGSGSSVAAAIALGRKGVGCDIRLSQCQLGRRRCAEVQREIFV